MKSHTACIAFLLAVSSAACGVALLTNYWVLADVTSGSQHNQYSVGLLDLCQMTEVNGRVTMRNTCQRMQEIDEDGSKNEAFLAGRISYWVLIGAIGAGCLAFVVANFATAGVFSPRHKAFVMIVLAFLHAGGLIAAWVNYAAAYFNSKDFKRVLDVASGAKQVPSVSFYGVVGATVPAALAFVLAVMYLLSLKRAETVAPNGKDNSSDMGDE